MKTTGLFTIHQVTIPVRAGVPIKLIPFGDIHRDSTLHCKTSWQEFLAYAKKQKNAYFLGLGDYTDGVSTTEREILGGGLHETTVSTIESHYRGVVKTLANELAFMKGRLLGLVGGNHYVSFKDGTNSDNALCAALQAKFLGVCSFVRVNLKFEGRNKCSTLDIFAHHGKGGGITPGATLNTIEKMLATADADIYLMGHDHKKAVIPSTPRLRLVHNVSGLILKERTPWLGRTGSFLKAYEDGEVSYNVDAGRSPCALGWIEFELTPTRVRSGGEDRFEIKIRGTS